MLAMGFDRQRNVLLLTLLDTFDTSMLAVMDAACATFFDAEGPSHSIFDFTSTQKVVMAPLSLERRAHKPAMCVGASRPGTSGLRTGRHVVARQRQGESPLASQLRRSAPAPPPARDPSACRTAARCRSIRDVPARRAAAHRR